MPKSKKLLKLTVRLGEESRTLVAGIAEHYRPDALVGRKVVVVANLEPATLMGVTSNGMVLAGSAGEALALLALDRDLPVRREGPLDARARRPVSSPADPFLRQRTDRLDGRGRLADVPPAVGHLAGVPRLGSRDPPDLPARRAPRGWIVGYVVGLWLLFAVLSQTRDALLAGGRHLVVAAGDYTIQTLYHGLLLFVLPGYFASTTFDGITVVFFAVLVAAALLTTVDPWYRALVHPRPWLGLAFFGFSLFAGLNVALPLVGVPPAGAVVLSAALGGPRPDADVLRARGTLGARRRAGGRGRPAGRRRGVARAAGRAARAGEPGPPHAGPRRGRSRAGRARGARSP